MTKLLISVRSANEAAQAVAAGVDLIDVKEPSRGSLGAADAVTIRAVLDQIAGAAPVSAALGELLEFDSTRARQLPADLQFAKLGLAGCRNVSDWRARWSAAADSLPPVVDLVAVVYADDEANAPDRDEILTRAIEIGCRAVLVDTYDKRRGNLLTHWSLRQVAAWIESVRDQGLISVLAGSLSREAISQLLPLGPDFVAVRGAACRGARDGVLDRQRLEELVKLVREPAAINVSLAARTP